MSDPAFSATDHGMMAQALRLAERAAYTTKPNPMVGCVSRMATKWSAKAGTSAG